MKKKEKKGDLSEKEKRIVHLYYDEHNTFQEIMKIERCSPNTITKALKKHAGELTDEENEQDDANYAEMYGRFQRGQGSVEVATALNMPIDKIQQEYIKYLDAGRIRGFARMVESLGYSGIVQLQSIYRSMQGLGYNDPKLAGSYVKIAENMANQGHTSESLRKEKAALRMEIQRLATEIEPMKRQKAALENEIKALEKEKIEKAQQIREFQYLIIRSREANPAATAAEAARNSAMFALNDRSYVITTSLESLLCAARAKPELRQAVYWFMYPDERPRGLSDQGFIAYFNQLLAPIANEIYEKLLKQILAKSSQA